MNVKCLILQVHTTIKGNIVMKCNTMNDEMILSRLELSSYSLPILKATSTQQITLITKSTLFFTNNTMHNFNALLDFFFFYFISTFFLPLFGSFSFFFIF